MFYGYRHGLLMIKCIIVYTIGEIGNYILNGNPYWLAVPKYAFIKMTLKQKHLLINNKCMLEYTVLS